MDLLPLRLPVHFVARDVLQVLVAHDVVLADDARGVADNVLGDARFAGYLDGEAAAGVAYAQQEEGLHGSAVVEHGAVDDAGVRLGVELEVLVVCRDDAPGCCLHEAIEHSLGQGTAYLRLRAAAELVDEQQALRPSVLHHRFQAQQVGAVGREVVLDALFVAYAEEDITEDTHDGAFVHRHGHAALQHVL